MSLSVTGKLVQKLELQSGIGKTGTSWQKQEFVIETIEQYPKKICSNLWGDKIAMLDVVNIGDTIIISFSLESREFNGKWYTDVRAWKIETPITGSQMPSQSAQISASAPSASVTNVSVGDSYPEEPETYADEHDDLPF